MTDARELVKPLEWVAGGDNCCTTAGDYEIWREGHGYQLYFGNFVQGEPKCLYCIAEEAAWEHHCARILSALNPAFLERVERFEAALEEISEYDTGATAGLAYTAKLALSGEQSNDD